MRNYVDGINPGIIEDPRERRDTTAMRNALREHSRALAKLIPATNNPNTLGVQNVLEETNNLAEFTDANAEILSRVTFEGVWDGPISTTLAVSVTDAVFKILDDVDPTKIAQFQLSGITTGTTRTFTLPNADTTLAGLAVAQTFTQSQTITPASGDALAVNPVAAQQAIITEYTESAQTANTSGIWRLAPTLSSAGTIGSQKLLAIAGTIGNLGALQVLTNIDIATTATPSANSSTIKGIVSSITGAGTANITTIRNLEMATSFTSTGTLSTLEGGSFSLSSSGSPGTITNARALAFTANMGGNVTTLVGINQIYTISAGTTTTLRQIACADPTGAGAVTTQVGLYIPNLAKATTNYSLDVGTAQSRHAGNLHIGSVTDPTAKVHIAAGTTAASTAPIKLTSGTVMTTAEAGAVEFTTDDFFATITTGAARKAFVLDDGTRLTSGRVPFATTNGRLTDDADMTFATDTLTVAKVVVGGGASVAKLDHGVYTPTLTNAANLDASTAYQCQWMRVGSVVTVSGKVDIDPTLAATVTQLGISLPVASDLGAVEDLGGVAFASGIAGQGAAIRGDLTNNRATLIYVSGDITNQPMFFTFTYRII